MLYAILCYDDEAAVGAWSREEDDACMARLAVVHDRLARAGRLGPVARLLPTTAATTLRKGRDGAGAGRPLRRDEGTAARFLRRRGAKTLDARAGRREGARAGQSGTGLLRDSGPSPSSRPKCGANWMTGPGLDRRGADSAARPQALGALPSAVSAISTLAEEAFQEACLRALR